MTATSCDCLISIKLKKIDFLILTPPKEKHMVALPFHQIIFVSKIRQKEPSITHVDRQFPSPQHLPSLPPPLQLIRLLPLNRLHHPPHSSHLLKDRYFLHKLNTIIQT